MALKDVLALIDSSLADVFKTVAYTPDRDRKKFADRIDATKAKFLATEPPRGKKDFSVANNVVEYRPTLNGGAVKIGGKDVSYVPAERFDDFLTGLKAAVLAGELDKELEAAGKGDAATTARAPRVKSQGTGTGRGWSEERRAAFAATIAARKAAKGS